MWRVCFPRAKGCFGSGRFVLRTTRHRESRWSAEGLIRVPAKSRWPTAASFSWMNFRNSDDMFWRVCASRWRTGLSTYRARRVACFSRQSSCWLRLKIRALADLRAIRKKRVSVRQPSFCGTRKKFPGRCWIVLICMFKFPVCLLKKSKATRNSRIQILFALVCRPRGYGSRIVLPAPGCLFRAMPKWELKKLRNIVVRTSPD